MRQSRLSGAVEGVMGNHDSYSDFGIRIEFVRLRRRKGAEKHTIGGQEMPRKAE